MPASEVRAPLGRRMANAGMCSNESGMEKSRIFMGTSPYGNTVTRVVSHCGPRGGVDPVGSRG